MVEEKGGEWKNREKVKEERKIWRTYFTDILKLFLFLTLRRIVNITEHPNFFTQQLFFLTQRSNHLQHSLYDFFTFSNFWETNKKKEKKKKLERWRVDLANNNEKYLRINFCKIREEVRMSVQCWPLIFFFNDTHRKIVKYVEKLEINSEKAITHRVQVSWLIQIPIKLFIFRGIVYFQFVGSDFTRRVLLSKKVPPWRRQL